MPTDSEQVRALYLAAIALPASERAAFLREAHCDRPAVRNVVEQLIATFESSVASLNAELTPEPPTCGHDRPADGPSVWNAAAEASTWPRSGREAESPTDFGSAAGADARRTSGMLLVGRYLLVEQIGEGGMGSVWRAEQSEPIRRTVAVKLIKSGLNSRDVIARFEAERQALALIEHPNVARVFDGGTAPDGRPFIVMELVDGEPMNRYCDIHRLAIRDRLALFVEICRAVQHAHQKGIIHRDLKPSNVLVAEIDGRPQPKVIDFGVAKAIGDKLTEATLVTGAGIVGTPEYMSPEQAGGSADIDTRTDVYALGVILYELLTGSRPFDDRNLSRQPLLEVLRVIRDEEPPRLSTRLSAAQIEHSVAENRSTDSRSLSRQVRGDLEWITLRAMAKEPDRRYPTANGLARDIERYLAGEPIEAAPPSASYRVGKFVRRHRGALLAASAFLVLLAGSAGISAWLAVRATSAERDALNAADKARAARARTRAALDEVSSEAVETLLAQQRELTDRHKAFLRRSLELYAEFAGGADDDPAMRAEVAQAHQRMGNIRMTLGELPEARLAFERAVALFGELADAGDGQSAHRAAQAKAAVDLGIVLTRLGERSAAEMQFQQASDLFQELATAEPHDVTLRVSQANVLVNLANMLADRRERAASEQRYRRAIAIYLALPAKIASDAGVRARLANARYNLAILLLELGRGADAEAEYRRAIEINERLVRENPKSHDYVRRLSSCLINLSEVLAGRSELEEAEKLHRRGLEIQEGLVREYPAIPEYRKYLGRTQGTLAGLLQRRGKIDEARAMNVRSIETRRELVKQFVGNPQYRRDLGSMLNNVGWFEEQLGNLDAAETQYRAAIEVQEPLVREFPKPAEFRQELSNSHSNLGSVLFKRKQFQPAANAIRQAMSHNERLLAEYPGDPEYLVRQGDDEGSYAQILCAQGRHNESLEWFDRSIGRMAQGFSQLKQPWPRMKDLWLNTRTSRTVALAEMNRFTEALADWDAIIRDAPAERQPILRMQRCVCLAQSGKAPEAVAEAERLLADRPGAGDLLLGAARVYAQAAKSAAAGDQRYAEKSLAALQGAAKAGAFKSAAQIAGLQDDRLLSVIRDRPDFQNWFAALKSNP